MIRAHCRMNTSKDVIPCMQCACVYDYNAMDGGNAAARNPSTKVSNGALDDKCKMVCDGVTRSSIGGAAAVIRVHNMTPT
jgi:hypothetical protein